MDIEKLYKLHDLKEKGIITAEEFEITKQQILDDAANEGEASLRTNSYCYIYKSLWEYFNECLIDKYACFKGRASRKEFWGYQWFRMLIGVFLVLFFGLFIGVMGGIFIVSVMFLLPDLAVLIRRYHDVGLSAACFVLSFVFSLVLIPILLFFGILAYYDSGAYIMELVQSVSIGGACLFNCIVGLIKSEPKENRYGPIPDGVLV